ncbi:T9SS type A sorting domain-containing protein [Hymenobacter negativus]|uniref:T9SS type A sorting domain-containing protein n=1 Tax=Hymenobacter negativus TaxID=2795026 RepID=A0ABS0Q2T3_9BACT|nr:T9SS type A sorting domain-containing protein [Hymenobacter negativus]MBH8556943.1 T9SS type A sorting domain-containing protein [Hymenobacter negativus]
MLNSTVITSEVRRAGHVSGWLVLLLVLVGAFPGRVRAQLPVWTGATSFATSNQYAFYPFESVVDANGDIIMVGKFQGSITLGTLPTLTAQGFNDVYVAKMNGQTRQWMWAVRGGGGEVHINKVLLDSSGDILLAGAYVGTASFGNLPVLATNASNGAAHDLVVKLSAANGTWLWATGSTGLSSYDADLSAMAIDAAGDVIVSGNITGTARFGTLPTVTNQRFVNKLSGSTGQWQWVQTVPSAISYISAVAVEASGNVAISGNFTGPLTLGSLPAFPGNRFFNLVVAKLAPATGQWLWAAQATGNSTTSATRATSLTFSPAGEVVAVGYMDNSASQFGSLPAVTGTGIFLAKLDGAAGAWQWVQTASPRTFTYLTSAYRTIAFDATGDILTAGAFTGTLTFGPSISLTSAGSQDVFVSKVDAATGQTVWATRAGSTGQETVHSLRPTSTGELLLTGSFESQTDFGFLPTLVGTPSPSGGASAFLAHLSTNQFAVTTFTPARNASVAAASPVQVAYSRSLAATSPALTVFGDLRQGRKSGTGSQPSTGGLANNAVRFVGTQPFSPNELVSVSVAGATAGSGGASLPAWIYQFRAAVGGTGRGLFTGADSVAGAWQSTFLTTGDLDNDGDLDVISAGSQGQGGAFTLGLNDGSGRFAAGSGFAARGTVTALALADVDADGDLDVAWAAHYPSSDSVLVRFNNGSGGFTGLSKVLVSANPRSLLFGDLDADGDLDLLTTSYLTAGSASVRLNNGAGVFTGAGTISLGANTFGASLGDLDNDGDLDIVATNEGDGTVSTVLNDGTGSFGTAVATTVGALPHGVMLSDIDKDGDLDIVISSAQPSATTLAIGFNNGAGHFSVGFSQVGSVSSFSLADIDADGDFDLLTLDKTVRTVRTWLNDGSGTFNRAPANRITSVPATLILGDLDGDGDIDWLTANTSGTLSARFNTGTALATQAKSTPSTIAIYPNPAHQQITVDIPAGTASVQLSLINAIGQEVLHYQSISEKAGKSVVLDIKSIPPGVYHLRMVTDAGSVSKALVIE